MSLFPLFIIVSIVVALVIGWRFMRAHEAVALSMMEIAKQLHKRD